MNKQETKYIAKNIRKRIRMNLQGGDVTYKLAWAIKSVLEYKQNPVWDFKTKKWILDNKKINVYNTANQVAANIVAWDIHCFQFLCYKVYRNFFDTEAYQFFMPSTKEVCQWLRKNRLKAYR